jgi:predicted AAA+ superfamily ATPase
VESHLQALEITRALTLVRPFHGGGQAELVRQPKVYAFDTGFVSFARGWDPLRPSDLGVLWEHLALEALQAAWPDEPVRYWRDKAGREVDFVRPRGREEVDAYECKWSPEAFEGDALKVFRAAYPNGRNYLLSPITGPAYGKRVQGMEVTVTNLEALASADAALDNSAGQAGEGPG